MKRNEILMVLFVALVSLIGLTIAEESLNSQVHITQADGTLAGSQYTGSGSSPTAMNEQIQTGMESVKPSSVSEKVDNVITQTGCKDEDASIANSGKVINNGGFMPTLSAKMDYDNKVYQTASGYALETTSGEVNKFAVDGNVHDVVISGDNTHVGAVYGAKTVASTTEFNRADIYLTPSSCWWNPSKADIGLTNNLYDDPAEETGSLTNVVAGDPWTGKSLLMAKAGTLDVNLLNNAVSGASDKNKMEEFNVGYLGGNFNDLDATNRAYMFPTGLKTTVGSIEGNEGHTAGIYSTQDLNNFGTLFRAPLGSTTSGTSNDYTGDGTTQITAGTVVTIS